MTDYEGPRGTRKEELPALLELAGSIFGPPFSQTTGVLLFREDNLENLRIMLHRGRPVSHVGLAEFDLYMHGCQVKVGCVGFVCTHPDYRGQGLASRLLEDAWEKLRADGVDFSLISGSRGLYRRAGCAECGPTYAFVIPPAESLSARPSAQMITGDPRPYLEEMLRLYLAEPVHFSRSREQLQAVANLWPQIREKAAFALLEGRAYLVGMVNQWTNGSAESSSTLDVVEYAGDRRVFGRWASKIGATFSLPLRFFVPTWDEELRGELARAGEQRRFCNSPEGTVKILALQQLMSELRPFWEPRLGTNCADRIRFSQQGEQAQIALGQENLLLEGREIAELVFKTAEAKEDALRGSGSLGEALARIFPLPRPRYGLNYI